MNAPSLRRSTSDDAFSDPAKSIKFNCETRTALADLAADGFHVVGLPGIGVERSLLSTVYS